MQLGFISDDLKNSRVSDSLFTGSALLVNGPVVIEASKLSERFLKAVAG